MRYLELLPIYTCSGCQKLVRTRSWGGEEGNDVLNDLCHLEETGPSEKDNECMCSRSGHRYSNCDLRTKHISVTWKLVRDAGS